MPRRVMTRAGLWVPPVLYMAIIFYVSSQSDPLPAVTARVWDKLLHVAEYAALGALFARAILREGFGPVSTFAAAVLLAAAYGATDEYHQSFVPMRNADLGDWIVDIAGASLGALAYVAPLFRPARRTKVLRHDQG